MPDCNDCGTSNVPLSHFGPEGCTGTPGSTGQTSEAPKGRRVSKITKLTKCQHCLGEHDTRGDFIKCSKAHKSKTHRGFTHDALNTARIEAKARRKAMKTPIRYIDDDGYMTDGFCVGYPEPYAVLIEVGANKITFRIDEVWVKDDPIFAAAA